MKKMFLVGLVLSFLVTFTTAALAARKPVVETALPQMSEQERAALASRAVETLNQQSWTIYLTLQGAKLTAAQTDTLTFSGSGVVSQNLSGKGYGGSQYSLHVQDDGSAVWETVQRDAQNNLAIWRGELRGNSLIGTSSLHSVDGATSLYSFSTSVR